MDAQCRNLPPGVDPRDTNALIHLLIAEVVDLKKQSAKGRTDIWEVRVPLVEVHVQYTCSVV